MIYFIARAAELRGGAAAASAARFQPLGTPGNRFLALSDPVLPGPILAPLMAELEIVCSQNIRLLISTWPFSELSIINMLVVLYVSMVICLHICTSLQSNMIE